MLEQTLKQDRKKSAGSSWSNNKPIRSFDCQSNPLPILIGVWFFIHRATDNRRRSENLLQSRGAFVGEPQNSFRPSQPLLT